MQTSLPIHGEIAARPDAPKPRLALARKGFRPFFFLAAAHACAIVPLWILVLRGVVHPGTYLDVVSWHAHEMVLGFAVAVIAGFLLTAVGNWTQRETLVGAPLLALAALWLGGRVAMLVPDVLPRAVVAAVDLAFLPALIVVLARPLAAAKNRRNFIMLGILAALFAANAAVHLHALGVLGVGSARGACLSALDVVVVIVSIIAGRVFPMFTRNATGIASIRSRPALDVLTLGGLIVLTAVGVWERDGKVASTVAVVVGVLAIARAAGWGARHALRIPLLWILHAGYAWIPVGLLLRPIAGSAATHALTVGAIGSLTLGMMARVALGHTGRPLVAPRLVSFGFGAMTLAAFARVVVPLLAPALYFPSLVAAAALWAAAFLAYLVAYTPILLAARVDGKPG